MLDNSVIENCSVTGTIAIASETSRSSHKGLIVGQMFTNGENKVLNCHVEGSVTDHAYLGGLVGFVNASTLHNCYSDSTVIGINGTGGLIGMSNSIVKNSYYIPQSAIPEPLEGTVVTIDNIKSSNWFKNVLKYELEEELRNNWYYEDGYYPLLYKLDENGNSTATLLEGQAKRKV